MKNLMLDAIRAGIRTYDLAQPLHQNAPCAPAHPGFRFALVRRHGDVVRDDGVSSSSEMMMMSGHSGTHVDGLAHISCNGLLHGDLRATEVMGAAGFKCLG